MEVSFTTVGFENGQNLKLIFWKECIKVKKWKTPVCLQNYTHTIVHSSAMHYQIFNVIHKPSKTVINNEKCKKFFF